MIATLIFCVIIIIAIAAWFVIEHISVLRNRAEYADEKYSHAKHNEHLYAIEQRRCELLHRQIALLKHHNNDLQKTLSLHRPKETEKTVRPKALTEAERIAQHLADMRTEEENLIKQSPHDAQRIQSVYNTKRNRYLDSLLHQEGK